MQTDIAETLALLLYTPCIFQGSRTFSVPETISLVTIFAHCLVFHVLERTPLKSRSVFRARMNRPDNTIPRLFSATIDENISVAFFQQVFLHSQIYTVTIPDKYGAAILHNLIQYSEHFLRQF